jgi:hypothetical protein
MTESDKPNSMRKQTYPTVMVMGKVLLLQMMVLVKLSLMLKLTYHMDMVMEKDMMKELMLPLVHVKQYSLI